MGGCGEGVVVAAKLGLAEKGGKRKLCFRLDTPSCMSFLPQEPFLDSDEVWVGEDAVFLCSVERPVDLNLVTGSCHWLQGK